MILKFYELPIWAIAAVIAAALLLSMELGAWNGRRLRHSSEDPKQEKNIARNDIEVGALLALLGLMLAFTYSFGLSRIDLRKQALVNEANALGTAYLRADLLPEPGRTELRSRLKEYAETRIMSAEASRSVASFLKDLAISEQAQEKIWPTMKLALSGDVPGHLQILTVQSINEVLDAHTSRLAVGHDRLPFSVFVFLLGLACLSIGLAAQNAEIKGALSRVRISAFALALAALIFIIVDFDNSSRGLVKLNQTSLLAVLKNME